MMTRMMMTDPRFRHSLPVVPPRLLLEQASGHSRHRSRRPDKAEGRIGQTPTPPVGQTRQQAASGKSGMTVGNRIGQNLGSINPDPGNPGPINAGCGFALSGLHRGGRACRAENLRSHNTDTNLWEAGFAGRLTTPNPTPRA
ncbi:MAG: hypothetical protein ACLFQH_07190, partial [Halothiobacillaceae bacterium]